MSETFRVRVGSVCRHFDGHGAVVRGERPIEEPTVHAEGKDSHYHYTE